MNVEKYGETDRKDILKRIVCMLMMLVILTAGIFVMSGCTGEKENSGDGEEQELRAADPMTEEEIEADDSEGCVEDSEDLLY